MSDAIPPRLSVSSADTWHECRAKWKAKYLDRIEDPPGPEALAGTLTHLLLEHLLSVPVGLRDRHTTAALAAELWPDDLPDVLRERALLLSFAALELPELTTLGPATPSTAERRLETELGGVPFVGIVDRTDELPSGAARVVDYKTGKRPDRDDWLEPKRRQVLLYAAAVEAVDRRPVTEASIVWIPIAHTDDVEVSRSAVTEAVDWLGETWVQIGRAAELGVYEPDPGPLCSWCPAVAGCEPGLEAVRRRARNPSKSLGQHGIDALAAEADAEPPF